MHKCLVTGAAGFIGYHLCERLLGRGARVIGVDNLNAYYDPRLKQDRLARLRRQHSFQFHKVELADRDAAGDLFESVECDVVFHLAAQAGVRYSIKNPHAYVESNLVAFMNVLEGCRGQGSRHLVYASSSSVYGGNQKTPFSIDDPVGNPVSLYAATKRSNELVATTYSHLYGMPITGLRLFTVYGPWGRPDMALYRFADAMSRGKTIDVYNHGNMRRDFTFVDDIVDGVIRAAESSLDHSGGRPGTHRLYNLGNNQPVELGKVISLLEGSMGVTAEKRYLPMQPGDMLETYADIEATTRDLGYEPKTSFEEGVEKFVRWHREYHQDRTLAPA